MSENSWIVHSTEVDRKIEPDGKVGAVIATKTVYVDNSTGTIHTRVWDGQHTYLDGRREDVDQPDGAGSQTKSADPEAQADKGVGRQLPSTAHRSRSMRGMNTVIEHDLEEIHNHPGDPTAVRRLQTDLTAEGKYHGRIDGVEGVKTRQAEKQALHRRMQGPPL